MKSLHKKENKLMLKEIEVSDLQKTYAERLERFMVLVEISYALKTAPRIIQKK